MALTVGTRIGRYEIRSQIGEGGMGEVYRAFDPKIGREVAIKVLPAELAADKERVARFEQEAKVAGALNHPNILAIYDVDTQDNILYVVSELLEGQELRDRLEQSPLSVRKAIEYAQQIVSGLSAAHEKGIVHRDLKPENLFITKDERVKILDFGIAKLTTSPQSTNIDIVLLTAGVALWKSRRVTAPAGNTGPPVIVLMDSPHPERVYDSQTQKTGGTNADDLTDLLRDLPVLLLKENTNATWHRELQVLQENPALIVAHRSCFYDTTLFDPSKYGDVGHTRQFAELAHDKFDLFMGYVGQGNPNTRFIVYSRGSWQDEAARSRWVREIEERFPVLRGRVEAMKIPLDRATFRNPTTGAEIRKLIEAQLKVIATR
jgi:predicted Ser/Thr protein kinase